MHFYLHIAHTNTRGTSAFGSEMHRKKNRSKIWIKQNHIKQSSWKQKQQAATFQQKSSKMNVPGEFFRLCFILLAVFFPCIWFIRLQHWHRADKERTSIYTHSTEHTKHAAHRRYYMFCRKKTEQVERKTCHSQRSTLNACVMWTNVNRIILYVNYFVWVFCCCVVVVLLLFFREKRMCSVTWFHVARNSNESAFFSLQTVSITISSNK